MGTVKKISNKSSRPDNVVARDVELAEESEQIQLDLPSCLGETGYFGYMRSRVLPSTRLVYLRDLKHFFEYLCEKKVVTSADAMQEITLEEIGKVSAPVVNGFLDYCSRYKRKNSNGETVIYENSIRSLSRKKSALTVFFKYLYRTQLMDRNITDAFYPYRSQKAVDYRIKALQDDEVMKMLDAVRTGEGLSEKERVSWEQNKKRDLAIIMLFITYGLRLYELQQLNLSSFNYSRGEFLVYRKRGKESVMPLTDQIAGIVQDYIQNERPTAEEISERDRDALFISLKKNRLSERQIRDMVKRYTAEALDTSKREGYSPHKLRATAATSLIGRGYSIYDVKELLDHESVETTQLYAAHRLEAKRNIIKDFDWIEDE